MPFRKNTLQSKIWLYLTVFSLIILGFLWFFQVVSLNSYYEWHKTKEINAISKEVTSKYKGDISFLDNLAFEKGVCIEVVKEGKIVYTSNNFSRGCIIGDPRGDLPYRQDFINSGKKKQNYKLINPRFSNKTLVSAIDIEDTYIFVNASLEPLDSSIQILKSQFVYVSLIVLALSFLIGYSISKKISKPMEKIGSSAKKMATGDYSVVFAPDTDIKELKELSDTLDHTRDELSKTDELRRELLSNVGHDLKTPLTMIQAYAEMVRDLTYHDEEKRNKNLNTIIEETNRLNGLVEDILDLSKMQASTLNLHLEIFDLSNLISSILNRYSILKETEKYEFIYNGAKSILVLADKKRAEQVIYNLINNAVQYTGEDNKIYIDTQEEEEQVKISIRDTGKGIDPKEIPYIWDKYYHSNKKHKRSAVGTGLGLSIVKHILELHECKYGVDSSITGTTFYFYLPKEEKKEYNKPK